MGDVLPDVFGTVAGDDIADFGVVLKDPIENRRIARLWHICIVNTFSESFAM